MCLLKTGSCVIQVHFNEKYLSFSGNEYNVHVCLIQVACLIEVTTKTGFTVTNKTCG